MNWVFLGLTVFTIGGVAAIFRSRSPLISTILGMGGAVAGALLVLPAPLYVLLTGETLRFDAAWSVPYGRFILTMDPLAGLFLLPILAIGALAAIYGGTYLRGAALTDRLGQAWFFYNLLLASMLLVILAGNGLLFLFAWEGMAIASFFLVTLDDMKPRVQHAGWIYLVASHLGTAFLLVLFLLMAKNSGSMEFDRWSSAAPISIAGGNLLFILAVVGFGTKAGIWPFHVWLPEAHPVAPSHVSALMSGVMIKTGIYGLLRILVCLGTPQVWWGLSLVGMGLLSAILGVLFALAQHDLKRLLAYSSVENIGIITMGIGLGVLGLATDLPGVAILGFTGGLLHVVNHAAFKSLLFFGAGSVLHATGTGSLDRQGGLLKRMPLTGAAFLVGSVAISGLPPFNGFAGEFLIFLTSFRSLLAGNPLIAGAGLVSLVGLAMIGGLAAACFLKAFGIVFLGEPRTQEAARGHEAPKAMFWPVLLLASACLVIGVAAPGLLWLLKGPVAILTSGMPLADSNLTDAGRTIGMVSAFGIALLGLVGVLVFLRGRLPARRLSAHTVTWDCGYSRPTPRMQYSSSSFSEPLTELCRPLLRTKKHLQLPQGYFPEEASLRTQTPDVAHKGAYAPVFNWFTRMAGRLRWLQSGSVHLYVLYITVTLLILFVWVLGS